MTPTSRFLALVLCAVAPLLTHGFAADAAARDDSAAEKLGWKLATKAYTFIKEHTFVETLDITKALGLKYIEMNPSQAFSKDQPAKTDQNASPELRTAIKQALADHGVKAMGLGVIGLGKDEAADRKIFEYAKDLGIEVIISEPTDEAFPILDKLTAEFGIKVAIHNHPEPSKYWNPETVLKAVVGHSKLIGSCSDTGHWPRSALHPVDCLRQLEGRVISAHFKDTDKIGKGARDVVLGTGVADVKGMLTELKRQGFAGMLSLEYEPGTKGDALVDEVRRSIAYFDGVARELAK
jgi:sugar phosphate isomerase/epimerase